MKAQTMVKILVTSVLAAALAVTASASFAKKNTYGNQFADVKDTSWYAKEVASAYELGFVEGISDTQYSPDTTVTVAQGITMASRVHAEYNGGTIESKTDGGKWYQMYVDYAKENGIIRDMQFDDYTREIKRFEMAELFHDAMGADYYTAINSIKNVPDVNVGAMYRDKILTLYNAGILTGNDEYGVFTPNASIKRSECAAIINRVAMPENRKSIKLQSISSGEAYVLCFNDGIDQFGDRKEGITSGWIHDNRGGIAKSSLLTTSSLGDVSEKYGSAFIREFNYIDSGIIVLEIDFITNDDGAYLEYRDIDGKAVYNIKLINGKWNILKPDGTYAPVCDMQANGNTTLRAEIDLGTGKSQTILNGVNGGTSELLSDNILSFVIGIDEKGTGALTVGYVNMVANYAVYEEFNTFGMDEAYGWTDVLNAKVNKGQIEMTTSSAFTKKFDAVSGNVIFETYFIMRNGNDFNIKLGNALTISGVNKKLTADGKELYNLTQNMWYRLRVEADLNNGTADVLLNGRSVGVLSLASKGAAVDYLTYESVGMLGVDNIKVYNYNKPKDYVPVPTTKASFDDYTTIMNICSLWRNSTSHYGWACITPYDERKPVLGYYDEGVPETADWEIKYMVEHGIDVQAFCWYTDVDSGPVKEPRNVAHLHDGYMYADYSDYMKYILLWEVQGSGKANSSQFRNYVVPYWFENYFLDDRYLKIDNKIVLTVYGYDELASDSYFGNAAGVKKEFDYLEEKAKSYGFDGFIFVYNGGEVANDRFASYGFDGSSCYNWSVAGKNSSTTIQKNTDGAKASKIYQIPSISVGYDTIAWHGTRYDIATSEEWNKGIDWIKNTYLPKYSSKADWADKLVWLSTWNEYGEGTFLMPAGEKGFMYVDALRNAFTNLSAAHTDVVPTAHQLERINHLYPQYATLARREGWYDFNKTKQDEKLEATNKLFINDVDVQANTPKHSYIPPKKVGDRVLFPYNGATAVDHILGAYSEWRKQAGTLKISANGHVLEFEANSNLYIKDGAVAQLGYTAEMFDGLIMLDFEKLAKDLEYKVSNKNGDVYITTDTYDAIWKTTFKLETGNWQFNNAFNDEGWTTQNMSILTNKGTMLLTTVEGQNDPIMKWLESSFPEDFETARFEKVEIKCRYDYVPLSESNLFTKIYYITDIDNKWSESKNIRFVHQAPTTNGEWVTYTCDLTTLESWMSANSITGIRFDPFDGQGTFEIDYLKFISPEGYVYVPVADRPIEIKNGDAELENSNIHTSHNATIIRIEDPENKENHVWHVKPTSSGQYTYFHTPVKYKEYMEYKIEYDIKLVANDTGANTPSTASFATNFKYSDKGALNDLDHIVRNGESKVEIGGGWVHYEGKYATGKIDSNAKSQFAVYVNPVDGMGFEFYLDNIKVTELGSTQNQFTKFDWETVDGKVIFDENTKKLDLEKDMCTYEIVDGKLVVKTEEGKNDPKFFVEAGFKAEEYDGVAVRLKAQGINADKDIFQIYFDTDEKPGLSESKSMNIKYKTVVFDDEEGYMTLLFDFSSASVDWKGTVTTLRIDPANAVGTYTFTDIVLVKA